MFQRWLKARQDQRDKLIALDKVQAVIEFAPDGIIRHANALFLQTMGYRRDEVVGQHHRLFVDIVDAASPAYEAFWQGLREGHIDHGLYRRLRSDGSDVWLQSSYNPLLDRSGRVTGVVKY